MLLQASDDCQLMSLLKHGCNQVPARHQVGAGMFQHVRVAYQQFGCFDIPSGNQTWQLKKNSINGVQMGKSSINDGFSIAMFNYQRVCQFFTQDL